MGGCGGDPEPPLRCRTPEDRDALGRSLCAWLRKFPGYREEAQSSLVNVLHEIDSAAFDKAWCDAVLPGDEEEKSWENEVKWKLLESFKERLGYEVGDDLSGDAALLPHKYGARNELGLLVLSYAVYCPRRAVNIGRITELSADMQTELMQALNDFQRRLIPTGRESPIRSEDVSELAEVLSRTQTEKRALEEQLRVLEDRLTRAEEENEKLRDLLSGFSSEPDTEELMRELKGKLLEVQEDLLKQECQSEELRTQIQDLSRENEALNSELHGARAQAQKARLLQDELDAVREQAGRAVALEVTLAAWKDKVREAEDIRREVKALRETEGQGRTAAEWALKKEIEGRKRQVQKLEERLEAAIHSLELAELQAAKEREKCRQLLSERDSLSAERASLLEEVTLLKLRLLEEVKSGAGAGSDGRAWEELGKVPSIEETYPETSMANTSAEMLTLGESAPAQSLREECLLVGSGAPSDHDRTFDTLESGRGTLPRHLRRPSSSTHNSTFSSEHSASSVDCEEDHVVKVHEGAAMHLEMLAKMSAPIPKADKTKKKRGSPDSAYSTEPCYAAPSYNGHQVVAAEVHVSDQSCDTPPGSALSSFHEGLHGEHPAPGFHRSHSPLNMPRGSIVSMPEGNVVTRRRRPHRPKRRATPPGRRHYSSSSSQQHYGFFPPTDTVSVDDFLLRQQGDSDEEGDYATVEDDDFSRRRNNGRTSLTPTGRRHRKSPSSRSRGSRGSPGASASPQTPRQPTPPNLEEESQDEFPSVLTDVSSGVTASRRPPPPRMSCPSSELSLMYHDLDLSDMETALAAQNGRFHREQPPDYELEVDEADAPYGPRVDEEAQYACVTRRSRVDTVRQKNKRRKKRSKSMEVIIDVMATLMCAP